MICSPLLALSLLALPAPVPFDPAAAPPALEAPLRRADEAIARLQQGLQARLGKALAEGGPAAAVAVCRDEAPRVAAEVEAATGVRLGRTSDRLRNGRNVPPAWAAAAAAASAGRRAADVRAQGFDLGDRVGVLRPIAVAPVCTRCHGAPEAIPADVAAALKAAYPSDRATGYAPGDHRGFFWAEAAR